MLSFDSLNHWYIYMASFTTSNVHHLFTDAKLKLFNKTAILWFDVHFWSFSKDEMKSDDSDEEAENEVVQSSSAPGKSPKIPKHDLTMTDEVSRHITVSSVHHIGLEAAYSHLETLHEMFALNCTNC